jgi:hypothetical protein
MLGLDGRAGKELGAILGGKPGAKGCPLLRQQFPRAFIERSLRLSIAGNILDFSIYADLDIAAAVAV